LKALSHVTGIVERRNTVPILSNVLLRAEGGDLTLTATDIDIEIVEHAPAMVSEAGGATAQAVILHDIVRKLPDGSQLELSRADDEGRMVVRAGKSRFELQALSPDDFPRLELGEPSHSFELDGKALKRLIEKTQFAISTEETRYYLNGVYFHVVGEGANGEPSLRMVATDGHRLAQSETALPEGAEGMAGVIIPRKTVMELRKLCDDVEGAMKIELAPGKIRFSGNGLTLTSKLIDGSFPDYERVIPKNNNRRMNLANSSLKDAVERVSILSLDRGRAVRLALEPGRLTLAVSNPDSGSAEETLNAEYEDEAFEIGFNARYVLDVAGQVESDAISFMFADPSSPTLVRDVGDDKSLFVLMPMRV
jgi:DNA polymerase-3 subunit beta